MNPYRHPTRRSSRRRGAITLEAAMIFPILLMIFFSSVEFAWMFYVRHTVSNAAREGVRAAIVPDASSSDVADAVDAAMARGGLPNITFSQQLKSGTSSISSPSTVAPGSSVTLEVTAPWSQFSTLNTGVSGFWVSDIKVSATMRREG